jgi:multidrug transporter EmrE-like cation transporter
VTAWNTLMLAILSEVMATTALRATEGFTRVGPSAIVLIGYLASFGLLSRAITALPLGVTYAIWSGFGAVGVMFTGWLVYGEVPGPSAILGVPLVVAGTWLLQSSTVHG